MKKIVEADKNDELGLFLMGIGKYQVKGHSDLPMPNDYNECWRQEIIPFSRIDDALPKKLTMTLLRLLGYEEDYNLALYTIIMTINWYYFFKKEGLINFEIELDDLLEPFKNRMCAQKNNLMQDTRWAGTEWNSEDGLWEPFLHATTFIKNKYDGVDLVPQC